MGVEDIIRDTWPNTERLLLADADSDYANAKSRAISRAIQEVYSINTSISPLPSLNDIDSGDFEVMEQVAEVALLNLIPMAKDYYMQVSTNVSESYQGAGSGSTSMPNRVEAMDSLQEKLEESVKNRLPRIVIIIGVYTPKRIPPAFFGLLKAPVRNRRRIF